MSLIRAVGPLVAAILALCLPADRARAASFDCGTAATPERKAVCASPVLSDLDEKIADAYHAALARLSPAGRDALAENQDQWIEATTAACAPLFDDFTLLPGCLEMPYRLRQRDLAAAVQTAGPFTFLRVSSYQFVPCRAAFECDGNFREGGYVHASIPRIDASATDATALWNARVAEKIPTLRSQDNTDVNLDFRIAGVSADMISVRFDLGEYTHRAAHGSVFILGFNTILPAVAPIAADDVFAPGAAWRPFLYNRAMDLIRASLMRTGWDQDTQIAPELMRNVVERPERWAFTPAGLEIMFGPYDLGFDVSVPHDATISWTELQPYLRKPMPFQLPQ